MMNWLSGTQGWIHQSVRDQFTMLASARGIPAAGLGFAAAMMLGIAITLGAVATLAVLGRAGMAELLARYGASAGRMSRWFAGGSGLLLAAFGLYELLA